MSKVYLDYGLKYMAQERSSVVLVKEKPRKL